MRKKIVETSKNLLNCEITILRLNCVYAHNYGILMT